MQELILQIAAQIQFEQVITTSLSAVFDNLKHIKSRKHLYIYHFMPRHFEVEREFYFVAPINILF